MEMLVVLASRHEVPPGASHCARRSSVKLEYPRAMAHGVRRSQTNAFGEEATGEYAKASGRCWRELHFYRWAPR
jgi:hypothetical protein